MGINKLMTEEALNRSSHRDEDSSPRVDELPLYSSAYSATSTASAALPPRPGRPNAGRARVTTTASHATAFFVPALQSGGLLGSDKRRGPHVLETRSCRHKPQRIRKNNTLSRHIPAQPIAVTWASVADLVTVNVDSSLRVRFVATSTQCEPE